MRINRKRRMTARLCSLLLAAVFVFHSAGSASGMAQEQEDSSSYYEYKEHADIDYADMPYRGVDEHALDDLLDELDEITDGSSEVPDPAQRTVDIYYKILDILDEEYTQYVLGDVLHYRDVTDEAQAEQNTQDMREVQDMSDVVFIALQKALQGPYAYALEEQFTDDQLNDLEEYQPLTDEERELLETEKNLQQKYDRLAEEDYVFEYKGRKWTLDRLYDNPPNDYDDIVEIYLGISRMMNEAAVPVYQDLVRTRRKIAELEGYDTYTDYAYDLTYGRDFPGDDLAALRETVVEELCPVYDELKALEDVSDFTITQPKRMSGEKLVKTLGEHIGDIHPELLDSFGYFRDHKLYYIDNKEEMADAGFTTDLPAYGSAMIYYKTNGTLQDLETMVHEFGHFNSSYHANSNTLMDSLLVDVAEIQSQGLEMLFLDEMTEIAPEDPVGLELHLVVSMLDSILSGFEYDEFQQEVYASDDMTAEELNRLATDTDIKYTQYFFDDDGESFEWVLINHTFDSPLYYIGYATSALSALDIWTQSLEDRDSAIDKYMRLSAVPTYVPYQEAVTSCGLRNMLDKENIRELANEIREWAGLDKEGSIGLYTRPEEESAPGIREEKIEEVIEGGEREEQIQGTAGEKAENAGEGITETAAGSAEEGAVQETAEEGKTAEEDKIETVGKEDRTEELLQDEYYDWEEEFDRQVFRVLKRMGYVNVGVRVLVLIIALIAHARKKRRDRDRHSGRNDTGWR